MLAQENPKKNLKKTKKNKKIWLLPLGQIRGTDKTILYILHYFGIKRLCLGTPLEKKR